ncbi:MAG: 2-oxoglutarate dehydrogenase complex dihydrolipoyllysine-residue succinyltransferase [Bdellovibrionales bacterium]|nr:2-oxoglutarate dehydrogenase complex dihydrolipoyllysine-residue succinyltransferase [Bdellovibrionales bacterium]
MKHPVVAPSVGESITEVSILKWKKNTGEAVKTGDLLLEIESDKATVEIVAEQSGVLTQLKPAGERIPIGAKIGEIDTEGKATATSSAPSAAAASSAAPAKTFSNETPASSAPLSPSVRKMVVENDLNPASISATGKGGRLTKGDVIDFMEGGQKPKPAAIPSTYVERPGDRRVPMSLLRQKIAERLVMAQHTAAILTTFNEVDMTAVMALRNQHKEAFEKKHKVKLSFMSFFTKASVLALKAIPEVNASMDGKDIIYHDYFDIGIAVGTDRGLVVPVVRGAEKLSFVEIEKKIGELALKARDGKLSIADMSGGTFTISNGGTYGSLMSTPILNPPQSGILGMHKTMDRPMAVNGKVEIRPMMYLALSYDHRIIDGKGAVTFLVTLKDALENPQKLGFEY